VVGATAIVNVAAGAAFTVTATGAVFAETPVPVAVIVVFAVPAVAVALAVYVTTPVVDPDGIVTFGAVKPAVSPVTASVTSPVNPPLRASVTVTDAVLPCVTVAVAAEEVMLIAGVGSVVPPSSSPPLHATIAVAAIKAVSDLLTSSIPTRTTASVI
jgi:hypothetical protein